MRTLFWLSYLITITAQAASFDCAKSVTPIEEMICNNRNLSALDEELAQHYKDTVSNTRNPASLKSEQRTWLLKTRDKCEDEYCLEEAYKERITVLKVSLAPTSKIIPAHLFGRYAQIKPNCWISAEKKEGWDCDNEVEDELIVTRQSSKAAKIHIYFTFTNGHTCDLDEIATWNGKVLVVKPSNEDECILELSFSNNKVTTHTNDHCGGYCGARGTLDGNELKKSKKTE